MNFNTFFLDKLSAGSQSLTSSSGKTSPSSYLFSDIMKVYEQENGTNLKSQSDSVNPNSNIIEGSPFSVNVIECNDVKLKTLSDFIKSFIANSQEPINISELKHDLQPVVISKKQFLLSANGMEDFIKGLVESIDLNMSDDLKAAVTLNIENSEELKKLSTEIKSDEKEIPLLEKESGDNLAADIPLLSTGIMSESILGFLSNNKSLTLSFKSNLEKVNINLYELPEDNFETKINIEKLASDFIKEGKKIGNAELESSNEIEREELVNTSFKSVTGNRPAEYFISSSEETDLLLEEHQPGVVNPDTSLKPVGFNAPQNGNVYKTEIMEISYMPNVLMNDLSVAVSSKAGKLSMDPIMLSGFTFNDSAVSDVKFRLNNNLSMQLKVDASVDKNLLESTSHIKTEVPNSNSLFIQQTSQVMKVTDADNNKVLSAEIKSEYISETVVTPDSKSPSLKTELPLSMNLTKDKVTANNNPDQAASSKANEKQEEVNNTKVLLNELNGKLIGVEFKKAVGKDESIKVVEDSTSAKSVPGDVAKESRVVIKNAVNKSYAEIEFEKNKSKEYLNSPLQETDPVVYDGELKDKKDLTSFMNGKLSGVEFKKAVGNDNDVKAIKENEGVKSVSSDVAKESKVVVKEAVNESSNEIDFVNYKSGDKFKGILQGADQIAGNDKKILFSELNGKLVGVDVKKTVVKVDNVKPIIENESIKSASGENSKENAAAVKGEESKSSDGKDFAKHKSNDSSENILHRVDQTNGNDSNIFKIAPELKTSHDVPKIIKTQEIISEFSKIIQTGEKQSMTFQLTPENLGKVKLIVELVENQINTRIEVENEQVKQFIQSNLEQLKQNLQSSGIQLSTVNVSLTESEQKFAKAFTPRKKSGERVSKVKTNDEETHPTQKSLGYNTYEFLA